MSPSHSTNRDSETGSDSDGEVSEQRGSKTPESDAESTGKQSEGRQSKSPESELHSPGNSEPRRSKTPESEAESSGKRRSKSPESDAESGKRSDNEARERSDREENRGDSDAESASEREEMDAGKKRKRAMVSDESGSDVDGARKKLMVSDDEKDEGEESVDKDLVIDAEALFGNASDISSEDEGGKKGEKTPKEPEEKEELEEEHDEDEDDEKIKEGDRSNDLEDGDRDEDKENEGEDQQMETRIDVEVPKITMNLGKELHFIKLPNFLSVETRPFDQANYEDEIDEEETLDEEGRARLKLKVENTIRWREVTGKNGELEKQSNARFVRWSDGSMSLHLGSEIFDVYKQSLHGDHNHLFIRQGTGLQGQAVFRTKLTFRPHSTESFTHRKMTMSLADRSQKTTGIKVLSLVGKDPEAHRGELIKKEEERLRASVRRASKQKRIREKAANRGLSANYLEPDRYNDVDSDDEVISINAIKKQHQNKIATRKGDRPHIYSSDEEGSDIETRRARRLDKAKALKDSDSEEDSGGGGGGAQSRARSSSRED